MIWGRRGITYDEVSDQLSTHRNRVDNERSAPLLEMRANLFDSRRSNSIQLLIEECGNFTHIRSRE